MVERSDADIADGGNADQKNQRDGKADAQTQADFQVVQHFGYSL
jgi:hypothetical protein